MRKTLLIVLIAALSVLQCGCFELMDAQKKLSETEALLDVHWNEQMGVKYDGVAFADTMKMDIYIPRDTTKARHFIIYVHGGGWTGGDRSDGELWCKYLTAQGFTTASIDYTLFTKTTTTNINKIDSQMCAAVQTAVQFAAQHGVTLTDMATTGFSAGSCHALLYAYKHAADSPLPIRFVFQQSGPTTFEPYTWLEGVHDITSSNSVADNTDEAAADWITRMSGHKVTPEMIRNGSAQPFIDEISPLHYINSSSVPTLSLYGELDGVVPPSHGVMLEEKLTRMGVEHIGLTAPNSGHAVACDLDVQEQFLQILKNWCETKF